MIPGFTPVDRRQFYGTHWPLIHQRVDALHSNWDLVALCLQYGIVPPALLIQWGYKDEATGNEIILAITQAIGETEEHWIKNGAPPFS